VVADATCFDVYMNAPSVFWPKVTSCSGAATPSLRIAPLLDVSSFVGQGRSFPESVAMTLETRLIPRSS